MSWREALRLSDVAFTELSLQAIYAYRQGNLGPEGPGRRLVARARRRVLESKVIVSFVLALLAFGAALVLRSGVVQAFFFPPGVPSGAFEAGVVTSLLSLDVAFLWWTGMQVLPTFLSSGVLPVLEPMPVDDRTLDRVAGLLYLRLFDLPALTVLLGTPILLGLVAGPIVGLAIVPGVVAAVAFSLALSLLTGRFFVRRVQGSRGGGGRTVVRWAYLVLWLVPAFAMFAFVILAPTFFTALAALASGGPSVTGHLLLAAFPFTLAVLPALLASGPAGLGLDPVGWGILLLASALYIALAAGSVVWVLRSVRGLQLLPIRPTAPAGARPVAIRTQPPIVSVLTKDLRIASRTPGFAFLILLPILDALAIGLLTYVRAPGGSLAFGIGLAAVMTAALLATFFGPAFFAVEVFAFSYGRTLPLSDRSLLGGKVLLVALMFLVAGGTVLGITLTRVFDPVLFAAFIVAELPAVIAASLLELGLLFRRARSKGLPITNLYSGAWIAVLVSVPGLLVAGIPLLAFELTLAGGLGLGLLAMAGTALGELGVVAPFALGRGAA